MADGRGALVVAGLVAVACWGVSLADDAPQEARDSFTAGQDWAREHRSLLEECRDEAAERIGPDVDPMAWEAGCTAVARQRLGAP